MSAMAVYTCVIILCSLLSPSLQNSNVKSSRAEYSAKRELIFKICFSNFEALLHILFDSQPDKLNEFINSCEIRRLNI